MTRDRYDIIIIGTGAGGGAALHRLAPSGKRILVLERGDFLPRERENWDEREALTNGRYQARETWTDADGAPFQPYTHYWVGGNTKVYGAALLRLRETDFGEVRHRGGVSPAWPITYEELEPYYGEAEVLFSVHGDDRTDPTRPRRSAPLPFPPLPYEPKMRALADALAAQGLHPFACPLGVRLREGDPTPRPPRVLGPFDGYPDPTGTKSDSEVVCIAPAQRCPNVTLLTGAKVERLETGPSGREIRTAVVTRAGRTERYQADLFILAAGAVNSAALLLRSVGDAHPRGLANRHDQVGRHYMCHNNGMLICLTGTLNDSIFQKAFAIADYYRQGPGGGPPLGLIQLMGKPDAAFLRSIATAHDVLTDVPADELWRHTVDFFVTAEDLPDRDNRVQLDANGGIRLCYRQNNTAAYEGLVRILQEHLERAGQASPSCLRPIAFHQQKLGISGVSHQCGTLRMGDDPHTSVVDRNCRVHDIANLYVTDSSVFASSGAVNPSLTIIANAMRVCDGLLAELGAAADRGATAAPAVAAAS